MAKQTKIDDEIASAKAALEQLIQRKKEQEKKRKMKITKQTPGISEVLIAIEKSATLNEIDVEQIILGIARLKKIDLNNTEQAPQTDQQKEKSSDADAQQIPAFVS